MDMRWSTTSDRGLRETERNVHAPGNQTKRSSSSDVLPPEMPLFAVVLPLPRVLPAQGSEHRSAQLDGCGLTLALTLSLSVQQQQQQQFTVNIVVLLSPPRSSQRAMHFWNLPTSSNRKMLGSKPRRNLFCYASPQWSWVRACIVKYH